MHTLEGAPISRRRALGLSAGALLSLNLWPGTLVAKETPAENFRFLVINDTHFMSDECGGFLDRVVQQMRWHRDIDFCLHVGDLVEKGQRDHLAAVRDIFRGLHRPVYFVPGNHDFIAPNDRAAYDDLFAGNSNYTFEHRGWQFIGLDSTQGTAYEKTNIQRPTLRWVDERIGKLDRNRPTVVFTHFPLGEKVRYRPQNADALLDKFRPLNLRAVFNGHFHGFTERELGNARVTTNRCCALKRGNHDKTTVKGYFLCTAKDGVIHREFIEVLFRPHRQPGRRVAV
jgi:hypothetical protein